MTMFCAISVVPLPQRAVLLLELWERLLKEAADAMAAELQLVSAAERQGVAPLWEAIHGVVCDVGAEWCNAFEVLRADAAGVAQRGAAPHATDGVAMEAPEARWVHALASASDASHSFLERLPALRRIELICRSRGYFGRYEHEICAWLSLHEALRIREAEIAAEEAGVPLKWSFAD